MFGWLKLLTDVPALLREGIGWLNKREDTKVAINRDNRAGEQVVDVAAIGALTEGAKVHKELSIVGMGHPIWWVAWALFVLPPGVYNSCIYWVSTFPSLGWTIQQVPAKQEEWGQMAVVYLLGAQVSTGIIKSIVESWARR
jgi:hypothetical protein